MSPFAISPLACGEWLSRSVAPQDIILFHDDNPCVLTVLDILLPRLAAQGFELQSIVHRLSSLQDSPAL